MLVCGTLPVTCIVPCGPWELYVARIPLGHETIFSSPHQVNEHSMVDITHDEAGNILKATHDSNIWCSRWRRTPLLTPELQPASVG